MAELLPYSSAAGTWAESVAVIAGPSRAQTRWNGEVMVRDTDRTPSATTSEFGLNGMQYSLFMLQQHVDAVQQTESPATVEGKQRRWDTLVEATGYVASQSTGLLSPLADMHPVGQVEADLNGGLADVLTQEQLPQLWKNSGSAQLMSPDEVPSPHFTYAGRGPAAAATRDVLTEIVRQQGQEPTSRDFVAACNELIVVPPDHQRWQALIDRMPDADKLSTEERRKFGWDLRTRFKAALATEDPQSGTPESRISVMTRDVAAAVRTATDGRTASPDRRSASVGGRLAGFANDGALTPGRTPGSDGASARPRKAGFLGVLRSLRSGPGSDGRR
ncbi:hypothetical protein [Kribbella sp. NPDC004536]|uniref:hypothetical protein n=1 Tax=Kribbella sp. NPDC004536 TaxID=3364106 RepID=UPI0036AB22C1